ncbi:ATP-binding protein [Streptomyces sp. NBC_00154]|uniref:ATP-binding protein n=1 Tax=Streptomyces sp. NBC_00154 TaxID=2975670 RepID=UPI00225BC2EA|nr:ATP-binding protein [Streptomyces sp. NBC_00154]MCX5314593.1 ATP-binding protein [Streptomyces sp. NBC_00154]
MSTPADIDFRTLVREIVDLDHCWGTRRPRSSRDTHNALHRGGGTCTLDLTAHTDSIEVSVRDHSPQAPRMRTPDLDGGTGGFGWPMVNRLARATAVTRRTAGGKTVSAPLAR